MADEKDALYIGKRVVYEDFIGSIKYIGKVANTKGEWLGIEWDDVTRGKHNGSYKNRQYFETQHPTSGSFIRQKVNVGQTFISAVIDRYGDKGTNAGIELEEMYVKGHNQRTTVEVVGAHTVNKQQSQFEALRALVLRGEYVNSPGTVDDIKNLVPNLIDLDISKSLLTSWSQVAEITRQLVHLKQLNVSNNRLIYNCDGINNSFKNITVLFMNRMAYTWGDVLKCSEFWFGVEELHLCFNNITILQSPPINVLQNIKLLNFEGNNISDWGEILKVSHLKHLEIFILNATGIGSVYFPDVELNQKTDHFPSLKSLSLSDNKISEQKSLHELDKLRQLECLSLKCNPLTSQGTNTSIKEVIFSCIANLKSYNRTRLKKDERRHCEWEYVKQNGQEWKAAGGHQDPAKNIPNAQFCEKYPRYLQLLSIYGAPEDSELVQYNSALKNNLLTLTITCPSKPGSKVLTKRLPSTMTIQKLKVLLHRVYKIDVVQMKLTYKSPQQTDDVYDLNGDQKDLDYFAMSHNDIIMVEEC